jgi:hypothetical protein
MYRPSTRLKRVLLTALVVLVTAGVLLLSAALLAEGEAADHVGFHVVFGSAAAFGLIAVQLVWRPGRARFERGARMALLAALGIFAAAMLVEGIGAFGFGADNTTVRSESLQRLHDAAAAVSEYGPISIAVTFLVAVVALLLRMIGVALRRVSSRRQSQEHG